MTNFVYDLKKVRIEVTNITCYHKSITKDNWKKNQAVIKDYKKKMAEIKNRDHEDWLYYRGQIRSFRLKSIHGTYFQDTFEVKVILKGYHKKYSHNFRHVLNTQFNNFMPDFRHLINNDKRQTIKLMRASLKLTPSATMFLGQVVQIFQSKTHGRVFAETDQILKVYVHRNLKQIYDLKEPVNKTNYIGIEIEFCAPVSEEVLAYNLFKRGFHKFVQLKKDGSLRPLKGETGFEFAILLREHAFKKQLKMVCDFIAEFKGTAEDRRCGLHVHFDMRKRNKDKVFSNLVACQAALLSITDPRRFDNEFCRLVKTRSFPQKFNGSREERYKTINAASYYRHKTIEVRMHEGTVDYKMIESWIDILVRVVNYDSKLKNPIKDLSDLKRRMHIPEKTYKPILDKSCNWQVNFPDYIRNNNAVLNEIDYNSFIPAIEPHRPRPNRILGMDDVAQREPAQAEGRVQVARPEQGHEVRVNDDAVFAREFFVPAAANEINGVALEEMNFVVDEPLFDEVD